MSEKKETKGEPQPVVIYKSQDVAAFFGVTGQTHLSTFDPTTPEGAELLVAAKLKDAKSIKECINLEIKIMHLFAHPASRVNPVTGEVDQWCRVCLITPDKEVIDCGSKGIADSLGVIALICGNPPWNPPVRAVVKARDLGNGKNFYTLEPIVESVQRQLNRVRKH